MNEEDQRRAARRPKESISLVNREHDTISSQLRDDIVEDLGVEVACREIIRSQLRRQMSTGTPDGPEVVTQMLRAKYSRTRSCILVAPRGLWTLSKNRSAMGSA